jgi:hypothetical protein
MLYLRSFNRFILISLTFLFGVTTVQATMMPTPDHSFGTLVSGTHSASMSLSDTDPNVLWFEFALSATSFADLDTLGSFADTVLALYNDAGTVLGQNDDCGSVLTSCLTFPSLGIGTYLAGVTNYPGVFKNDWLVISSDSGDNEITLNITITPLNPISEPATVWLFGTALIGLVGFSKRRQAA